MRQVHWVIIAILVLCVATSCITENTLPVNFQAQNEKSSTIPVEQAMESLNDFLIRHNQETKAMGVGISDVIVVSSQNVTRSNGESLPAIDSLLYLVNFENNSGYAILSADERIGAPIIAVTETGSINAQAFNINNRDLGNGTTSSDDFSLDLPIGNTNPTDNMIGGSQIVNDMIVEFVGNKIINGKIPNNTQPSDNTNSYWVAPILTTIWGQYFPYNLKCPVEENGEHNPAGCVAIALGQVLAHFEAERTDVNKEYDWQVIKSVGRMEDYETERNTNYEYTNKYNDTQKEEISTFLKDIGDMCDMN